MARTRLNVVLAGTAIAAFGFAPPATASTPSAPIASAAEGSSISLAAGCPNNGRIGYNYRCTTLAGGELYHRKYTNDIAGTWYKKKSGRAIEARLGMTWKGKNHYGSWFTQSSGTTKDWSMKSVTYCTDSVGLMQVKGQQTYQTPMANCLS
ncbi:hypothetical protein GL263_20135 [Streptomyces durbertensis]|uniref:Secreted protein n=1 Tax=Streptomyces durbertensis TaxID=2448886 RepID=A0ABR6EKI0_9ACTN|nr:hypothetical protein [Streptomyces durbertensis]MBB1245844.1 hypothetical protein [Streptomyces durbertensis]